MKAASLSGEMRFGEDSVSCWALRARHLTAIFSLPCRCALSHAQFHHPLGPPLLAPGYCGMQACESRDKSQSHLCCLVNFVPFYRQEL